MDSDSERTPLTDGKDGKRYESIVSQGSSLIYCSHGRRPSTCCQEDADAIVDVNSVDHCHLNRDEGIDKVARKRLIFASVLCLMFMIAEVVGGLLANSLAIATDAAHLLTDFASFMISLFSIWIASRPATKRMSFGWYRAEVIGAVTSVLLIWVVTGVLVYMAVQRILFEDYEIDALIMLITAGAGVLVNIIMGLSLQLGGVPHGHSHGISDSGSSSNEGLGKGKKNINVRAAFIHVVGDFLQSVGVLVAAIIIYFRPDLVIFDPICTFLFSVLVLISTIAILRDALNVLMEGKPSGIDFRDVQRSLAEVPGVFKVHNLRIWALSMDKIAMSAHVVIERGESSMVVLKQASRVIRSGYDIFELTLQVEEYNEGMADCAQCEDLKD